MEETSNLADDLFRNVQHVMEDVLTSSRVWLSAALPPSNPNVYMDEEALRCALDACPSNVVLSEDARRAEADLREYCTYLNASADVVLDTLAEYKKKEEDDDAVAVASTNLRMFARMLRHVTTLQNDAIGLVDVMGVLSFLVCWSVQGGSSIRCVVDFVCEETDLDGDARIVLARALHRCAYAHDATHVPKYGVCDRPLCMCCQAQADRRRKVGFSDRRYPRANVLAERVRKASKRKQKEEEEEGEEVVADDTPMPKRSKRSKRRGSTVRFASELCEFKVFKS